MERIGITNIDFWFILDEDPIIKELILFDKLKYHYLGKNSLIKLCKAMPGGEDKLIEKMREIEILEESGLIEEYKDDHKKISKLNIDNSNAVDIAIRDLIKFRLSADEEVVRNDVMEIFVHYVEKFRLAGQLSSRYYSALLNEESDNYHIPVIRKSFENFESDFIENKKATTLSIILSKFPILQINNSIERVIEFKKDPDTKLKLDRLYDWMTDISRKNYSVKELTDKIDYLMMEYEKQLEIYNLKYDLGIIESILVVSLGVLENVLTFKFSEAAKLLFSLSKKDLLLMEAEQKMIGKEIAIIYKISQDNFS